MAGFGVGTAIVPVLPDMTKFGAATAAGVQKSVGGLGSRLKGAFGPLGVTLGAAFAVGFAKSAFSEFEEAEKSLAGFNKALENTNQLATINQDSFNAWLSDFALGIGEDDDALRDLSTKLVNAFDFGRFGPDAQDVLQDVTAGIKDMSAATGLAETRLTKMFLAILNDPAVATTQLQKLGVVTEAEADNLTEMAEAGNDAAVTTILLDKVTAKYAGTAAETTTESEKMSAAWGEFKETIGGLLSTVLKPIIAVFTTLFKLLASNEGAVKALAAALGVLLALKVATKINSMVGAFRNFAASVASINPATAVALAGLTLLSAGMLINAQDAETNKAAINAWVQALTDGGKTLEQFAAAMAAARAEAPDFAQGQLDAMEASILHDAALARINQRLGEGSIKLDYYRQRAQDLGLTEREITANINAATEALGDTGDEAGKAGRSYNRFAGLGKKAFKEWAASISGSLRSTTTQVSGFSKTWEFTARSFQRTVKQMVVRAKEIARAFRKLDEEAIPEDFRKWLIEQGPDAVRAFTQSSDEGQKDIVANWKLVDKATNTTERFVKNLDKTTAQLAARQRGELAGSVGAAGRAFDSAADRAEFYRQRLLALDGMTVRTTIQTNVVGGGSGGGPGVNQQLHEGGIVRRGTVTADLHGPEAIIPLSQGGFVVRGDLTMRDWRRGIAELDGELNFDDRGRV